MLGLSKHKIVVALLTCVSNYFPTKAAVSWLMTDRSKHFHIKIVVAWLPICVFNDFQGET